MNDRKKFQKENREKERRNILRKECRAKGGGIQIEKTYAVPLKMDKHFGKKTTLKPILRKF